MASEQRFIIDGNNLIHRHPELAGIKRRDFNQARHRLISLLDAVAGSAGATTVVFDGPALGPPIDFAGTNIEVLFSSKGKSADTVIEQMVLQSKHPEDITVVTSDRLQQGAVLAANGNVMSCDSYVDHLRDAREHVQQATRANKPKSRTATLGDFFPS